MSDINPCGSIWTKESKHPKPIDYVKEFQRLGYGDLVEEKMRTVEERLQAKINTLIK